MKCIWLSPVHDDRPALHHPSHSLDHIVDVLQRLTLNSYDISEEAWSDLPEIIGVTKQGSRCNRCRFECLCGSHTGLHKPRQLAGVLTEAGVDGVRSHAELHTELKCAFR